MHVCDIVSENVSWALTIYSLTIFICLSNLLEPHQHKVVGLPPALVCLVSFARLQLEET